MAARLEMTTDKLELKQPLLNKLLHVLSGSVLLHVFGAVTIVNIIVSIINIA